MDECLFVGDIFEIELWYETILVAPPNLPQLHAEGKVGYTWSSDADEAGSPYSLRAYDDLNRIAKFTYSKEMVEEDDERTETFAVTVKANDLRFTIDVSDTDSLETEWQLPCVLLANEPAFSISDGRVVEGDTGTRQLTMTISADEPVLGLPLTLKYCSSGGTASTFSVDAQVQHAAYDLNGIPFISYIEFQQVRAVFDASFPKYYNSFMSDINTGRGKSAAELLRNAVGWLDRGNRGNKILMIGENEGADYNVTNSTHSSGFAGGFPQVLRDLGYTVDIMHVSDAMSGNPSVAFFNQYTVTFYFSTRHTNKADSLANPALSQMFLSSIVQNVRAGMGLDIITDHSDSEGYGFSSAGNQIANLLYANISGTVDRTGGTDFDAVRATYGDHPLIAGITGIMLGDSSEGRVDTTPPGVDNPKDYDGKCENITFAVGEQSKTISFTVYGDKLLEGDEHFFVDISELERGTITRGRGIAVIEDDDVIPCGEGSAAGGTGIEWFDVSVGSEPGLACIGWEAMTAHDRFDVFRNGVFVYGNMTEIEDFRRLNGMPIESEAPYDYALWDSLRTDDNRAVPQASMGTFNRPGRAGAGMITIPHFPELGHPTVYQVRTDGSSGTAWNMNTYCEGQAKPALGSGGSSKTYNNDLWLQGDTTCDVLDMEANNPSNSRQFTLTFNPKMGPYDNTTRWDGIRAFKGYGVDKAGMRSKIVLKSNNLVIGETPFISNGATASITFTHDKSTDFRYLEVWMVLDLSLTGEYISDYGTASGGKHSRINHQYEFKIE